MERGNLDAALAYVAEVKRLEDSCELPIPGVGVVSVAELEKEILSRR